MDNTFFDVYLAYTPLKKVVIQFTNPKNRFLQQLNNRNPFVQGTELISYNHRVLQIFECLFMYIMHIYIYFTLMYTPSHLHLFTVSLSLYTHTHTPFADTQISRWISALITDED